MKEFISCEKVIDCRQSPLEAGWLRRKPTFPESQERISHEVWHTGPQGALRAQLVTSLDGAAEVALLCSFLLSDEVLVQAILRAADRGVRVYVLTASEQRIGQLTSDEDAFEQRMIEDHKLLLSAFAGKVMLRSGEHFHAKFLVIDPADANAGHGWLLTANFNKALTESMEMGIRLDHEAAQELAGVFNWAFWCEAERELQAGGNRLTSVRPREPGAPVYPQPGHILATLKDDRALGNQVLAWIESARQQIWVASYGLEARHEAVQALAAAARRGVKVTVLTRPRPAVAEALALLAAIPGVSIHAHDKLHAKALFVDGKALVMSANLEACGLDRGFEVGVQLSSSGARQIQKTLARWAAEFPWIYARSIPRGEHLGDFCPASLPLKESLSVVDLWEAPPLPDIEAADATRLEETPQPKINESSLRAPSRVLPQRIRVTWKVSPPRLPKGSKERMRKIDVVENDSQGNARKREQQEPLSPRVFENKERVFVLYEREEQENLVRMRADELNARIVRP